MDLRQLRCLVAVADTLHFGRAARRMDMLPASFGRQIRLLEEQLGKRLLVRTTRHVSLTEAGRAFAEAGIDAARPGATHEDLWAAMWPVLEAGGARSNDVGRMGHGLGAQIGAHGRGRVDHRGQ